MAKQTAAAAQKKGQSSQPPANQKKDALTKTNPQPLAKNDLQNMFEADEGAGQENIGAKDLAIPRITILQAQSPQCMKGQQGYIKGAEAGDFYSNVANEVIAKGEEGFLFIPVSYRRTNIEWIPKKQGGGFVADHGANDAILAKCKKSAEGQMMLDNGHEVVTTAEYFVIILDKDGNNPRQAVISMAKTQLKKARKLNTAISSLMVDRANGTGKFNPAMFYSVFAATTVPESNDKGSWMGWSIVRDRDTKDLPEGNELYLGARQFRESVTSGNVQVAAPHDDAAAGGDGGTPDDGKSL